MQINNSGRPVPGTDRGPVHALVDASRACGAWRAYAATRGTTAANTMIEGVTAGSPGVPLDRVLEQRATVWRTDPKTFEDSSRSVESR